MVAPGISFSLVFGIFLPGGKSKKAEPYEMDVIIHIAADLS
jgi:hypothetical protein